MKPVTKTPRRYQGSVYDLRTLKERCWIDSQSKCWHLRSANGKPMPKDTRHTVWVSNRGTTTATRAAWEFYTGQAVPKGMIVYRTCGSYDCVNPAHLAIGTRADHGAMLCQSGVYKGNLQRILAGRKNGEKRRKVDAQARVEIAMSTDSSGVIAKRYNISAALVWQIKRKATAACAHNARSSAFAMAGEESRTQALAA